MGLIDANRLKLILMFNTIDPLEAIDNMPTVEQSRWIPCGERLPEKGKVVLITNDKGNVRCGQYRGVWSFYEKPTEWVWRGNTVETVIAWMPLPDAYKEGD